MRRLAFLNIQPWRISLDRKHRDRRKVERGETKDQPFCRWWFTATRGTRMSRSTRCLTGLLFLLFGTLAGAQSVSRVGAFPNITHAQAMVGKANGWFERGVGPGVKIEWTSFNAGPSAIEALFAGAIDMTYVGPNPAINGYVRSNGEALRVVAGAASGGASLIVRNDAGINKPEDFHGKR